jgi:biotin/methionine sulfoxide reductase
MNSSHCGALTPLVTEGRVVDVRSFVLAPDPSLIIRSIPVAVHHPCRVLQLAVWEGWLTPGPGGASEGRGGDRFSISDPGARC